MFSAAAQKIMNSFLTIANEANDANEIRMKKMLFHPSTKAVRVSLMMVCD